MPWGVSGDDQKRSDSGSFDCDRSVKTTPRKNRAGIYWEEQVSVGGKIKSYVLHLSCLMWLLDHSVEILRR